MILKCPPLLLRGIPAVLKTVGDHLRAARIKRGLMQVEVADHLKVTESTVWNWENNRSSPPIHECKGVIDFLGYSPFPEPNIFPEELIAFRRRNGLRVRDAAVLVGVDPSSWSSWERKNHQISKALRERIKKAIRLVRMEGP